MDVVVRIKTKGEPGGADEVHGKRHGTGIKDNGFPVSEFERIISMTFDVYEIETFPTKKFEATMIRVLQEEKKKSHRGILVNARDVRTYGCLGVPQV